MTKKKSKVVAKHKDFKIMQDFDYWGNWDFVLLKNNVFVSRHCSFAVVNHLMYKE